MKKTLTFLVVCVAALAAVSCCKTPPKAVELKCEYLENPIGMDSPSPRFTWMQPMKKDLMQSAYRVCVGTDPAAVIAGNGDQWDSDTVGSCSNLAVYAGKELKPFTRYYWAVAYKDAEGKMSPFSDAASFETGMMNAGSWTGKWISDGKDAEYGPAPEFRKEFDVNKKVVSARAYVSAGGYFELSINGAIAGDELLNPTFTRFDRRNLYVTLDVTSLLKEGRNALGVVLGNGWYNHQIMGVWKFEAAAWRDRPRFVADLRLTYDDGTTETISTDTTWRTADSPIIWNNIYTAEHFDARLAQEGWNKAGFDDSAWAPAVERPAPSAKVESQMLRPVRVTAEMQAQKMIKKSDTCYLFIFPENMAGKIRITASGPEGTVLRILHGEILDSLNNIDMSNINYFHKPRNEADRFQSDMLILSGKGKDVFTPAFNYKGFQYVEVTSSAPITLGQGDVVALKMHSDVPRVGRIKSSNPILDRIWAATDRSYLANLFGYPTDCPQREKNGWTGDAHVAIETAFYNFDGITVYEKWLEDFRDEQQPNGVLPAIIPTCGWGYHWANGLDWTSAVAIVPWQVYMFYGDSRLLERVYDNIKSYVGYVETIAPDGITDWGLGDWIPANTKSDKALTCSIYYYIDADILSKAATLFGRSEDAAYYSALAAKIKDAINARFLDREKGIYCSGSQTEQSAPLFWGIVPEDVKAKVAENLYKAVEANDFHLDVGLLGSKTLLGALSDNGYADAAYKVATQKTYPSWGYWLESGLTTLSEKWSMQDGGVKRDASFNHVMFGEISAWMYKTLGGMLIDPAKPGFRHVMFKPQFVDGLDSFCAEHKGMRGEIKASWKRSGNAVTYKVTVPSNTTATFYPPHNALQTEAVELTPGEYKFTLKLKQ